MGSHGLKAIVIRQEGRANILSHAIQLSVDCGVDWDTATPHDPAVRELRGQLAAAGLKGFATAFSIPTQGVVQRWLDFEDLPEEEIPAAARHRLRKFIADNNKVYVTISEDTDPFSNERLVTIAPKVTVDRYAEMVLALGLRPVTAEPESNSLLRVAGSVLRRRSPLLRDGSAILIDIGLHRTRVDIIRDERVEFTREFHFGSHGFVARIEKELVLTQAEAEAALEQPTTRLSPRGWLQVATPGGIAQVDVNEPLGVLLHESNRLIRYFRSIYPERSYSGTVCSALLTGGLADLTGLVDFVERSLVMETGTIDPLSVVRVDLPEEQFVTLARSPYVFTTATGLALAIRNLNRHEKEEPHDRTRNRPIAA
ncbi:MAG: pilus assembly protein PilM [Fimbriimonadaceae bacterium]|nr:pilus assembly protein PilM [Fimbriimonadaceae bacterium]